MCKLKKSIYVLKQASRKWYLKFNNTITSYGFIENTIDRCIYMKVSASKFIILVLYVELSFLLLMMLVYYMILRNFSLIISK